MSDWRLSYRADPHALPLADRHYNRQAIGSDQFVPPGRCVCLVTRDRTALWVTSWPLAAYVKHAWPGAWVNSLFRNEGPARSSVLIREAVAITCALWAPPALGLITFVDPTRVVGVRRRGQPCYGYCYLKAGFAHVGFSKAGLWAWQLLPSAMPAPDPSLSSPLFAEGPA